MLSGLYTSLLAVRHKKIRAAPGTQAHLRTAAAMAMVKRPAASRGPVAPPHRHKKNSERRKRPTAMQMAAEPTNTKTLRTEAPWLWQVSRQHSRRQRLGATLGQVGPLPRAIPSCAAALPRSLASALGRSPKRRRPPRQRLAEQHTPRMKAARHGFGDRPKGRLPIGPLYSQFFHRKKT